jgi:hypothetical protein
MNLGLGDALVGQLVVLVWLVGLISPQWMLWYDRWPNIQVVGVVLSYYKPWHRYNHRFL